MAYRGMPREVFPEFSLGSVRVLTSWPGASPEDVERLVTLPLEEELEGLDGLREMGSISQEGLSQITLLLESERDTQRFLDDVRAAVARDLELPEEAEEPITREMLSEWPAIAVLVYGNVAEDELREEAERHRRALESIAGVSQVILSGTREPRVWVEVDPLSLERFGLTLEDVGLVVGARARDAPLGTLNTEAGDYLLRVDAAVQGAAELRDLPVVARPDGTVVRLHQVARVIDTFERPVTRARFNGQPCLHLQVNKQARGDAIAISREVRDYLERERERTPPGIALGTNSDLSVYVKNRLRVMQHSAALGGVLVLASLMLFLNVRVALMTAIGIPISFLGGLLIADAIGITMNMITMFALIVVLGMIVDDAIVVGENIYRQMEEGRPPREAAVVGAAEVGKPVLATILTTVAAFIPLLEITGTTGNFLKPLPLVVSLCLGASLLEALLVLPSHLAEWSGRRVAPVSSGSPGSSGAARPAEPPRRWYDPLRDAYVAVLRRALDLRYATLTLALVVVVAAAGIASYRIPFTLFDDFESKVFYVNLRAPADTALAETERRALPVEAVVRRLPPGELESVNMLTGVSYADASRFEIGQNLAQVWVELREDTAGRRPTAEVIEALRARLAEEPPPGIQSVDIAQPQAGPTGTAIDVSIRGPDLGTLQAISRELQAELASFPGVRDVRDNAEAGKREVRLRLRDHGRLLGFSEAQLGAQLRAAFEGTRFGRLRRGRDDVEITVKLPEELRGRRDVLDSLRVTAPNGARVLLASVAEFQEESGLAVISREDGERSVRVLADVNKAEGNAQRITEELLERNRDFAERHPGYALEFKGDYEETAESLQGLLSSAVLAAFLIYLILGTLFRSLTQPFVIMVAVPFGVVGMVVGHLVMDRPISLMSLIGLLALAGVVVNDSLILVEFVNKRRARGAALFEALVEAGRLRFRPILLTSITTMLGLSPLTFFASGQARFLQPMAITVFFGLGVSTFLILIVIPCAYGALEDLLALVRHPLRTTRRVLANRPVHPRGSLEA